MPYEPEGVNAIQYGMNNPYFADHALVVLPYIQKLPLGVGIDLFPEEIKYEAIFLPPSLSVNVCVTKLMSILFPFDAETESNEIKQKEKTNAQIAIKEIFFDFSFNSLM